LHDEQFVRTCFMTLLRRPADPEGLSNYLVRFERHLQVQIVAALVSSPEGGKIEQTLPGLRHWSKPNGARGRTFFSAC
jgi:hypothetical protein